MKTLKLAAVAIGVTLFPLISQAQAIDESSRFCDIGIGVGASEGSGKTLGMFTQRIAAEWIVNNNIFNIGDYGFALGVGFQIDNALGGRTSAIVDGSFDYGYEYHILKKSTDQGHPTWQSETYYGERKGIGLANAEVLRDNISLMPTVSLHGKFFSNIDVFATFGAGIGIQTYSLSDYTAINSGVPGVGFESRDFSKESSVHEEEWIWSGGYNDIDHAQWNKKPYKTKATFACAFFVGARYFFNSSWAINAQFGLVSANVLRKNGNSLNSYNILSVGATYSF